MSSLHQSNQKEVPVFREEMTAALENRDREIYALRQQLQALKTLYKNLKIQTESTPLVHGSQHLEYSKQRIEKLMAALAERERQMRILQQEAKQQQMIVDEECQKEKLAKQHALNEVSALHGQLDSLKEKISSNQTVIKSQQNQIQSLHHENALAASQLQMAAVTAMDKDILQKEYEKLKATLLNTDRKLESALLNIRDLEIQREKLVEDICSLQRNHNDLQYHFEEKMDEERRRQEHLQNTLNETESLAGAWERKYFEIYKKHQETDQKLKEFEKIQEKITHMKSMWIGFGEFFGETDPSMQERDIKEKAFASQFIPIENPHPSNEHDEISQIPHPFSL